MFIRTCLRFLCDHLEPLSPPSPSARPRTTPRFWPFPTSPLFLPPPLFSIGRRFSTPSVHPACFYLLSTSMQVQFPLPSFFFLYGFPDLPPLPPGAPSTNTQHIVTFIFQPPFFGPHLKLTCLLAFFSPPQGSSAPHLCCLCFLATTCFINMVSGPPLPHTISLPTWLVPDYPPPRLFSKGGLAGSSVLRFYRRAPSYACKPLTFSSSFPVVPFFPWNVFVRPSPSSPGFPADLTLPPVSSCTLPQPPQPSE